MSQTINPFAHDRGPRPWPEDWAGLVNGGLILCVPIAGFIVWLLSPTPGNMAIGRVPLVSDVQRVARPIVYLAYALVVFLPIALIVGWRTLVHAKHVQAGRTQGWQGVLEAGGVGLAFAWWVLLRPTLMNPSQAPPYLIAYGIIGAGVGLAVGFVLAMTAFLTLWIVSRRPYRSSSPG